MSVWVLLVVAAGLLIAAFVVYRRPETPASLRLGSDLPRFDAETEDGVEVTSDSLIGRPAVLIFLRGSWCPFCNEQVRELATHYRRINELGARLILVTPKPLDTTRRVAELFGVEFTFWLDRDGRAASQLGIHHPDAVPAEFRDRFGPHAIRPTVIVIDEDGVVRYAEQSRDVRMRTDPATIVMRLEAL